MSLQEFGYKEQLNRALTTKDLIIYGMIFMLPIAPFAVFGYVWDAQKAWCRWRICVGLIGMFFTALSYAAMSRAFPLAGSVYTYAQRGLHEIAGFFSPAGSSSSTTFWCPRCCICSVPSALRPIFPAVPSWIWLAGFISFNATVNLLGIEFTARVNRYMLVMELIDAGTVRRPGSVRPLRRRGRGRADARNRYTILMSSPGSTVAGATSIAVLSFLGFDGISTLSEESRGNPNAVGRATVIGFGAGRRLVHAANLGRHRSGPRDAFRVDGYGVLRGGGARRRRMAAAGHDSGDRDCVRRSRMRMAAQAAVSRILFAMARDGKLPAILAKVHPRYKTPYVSTLAVALVSLLVGLFFAERIDDLTRIVNFGALSGFVLLHLSVINHYFHRQRSGDWLRHVVFPLAGLAIIVYVLARNGSAAKILGACWLGHRRPVLLRADAALEEARSARSLIRLNRIPPGRRAGQQAPRRGGAATPVLSIASQNYVTESPGRAAGGSNDRISCIPTRLVSERL